jgi:hypothetical protein
MTPQEIATQAAEQFLADSFPTMSQFLTVEACHKARRDKVAALILTAARAIAAQMVRDSGADVRLEAIQEWAKPEHVLQFDDGDISVQEWCHVGLAKLRAITEQP